MDQQVLNIVLLYQKYLLLFFANTCFWEEIVKNEVSRGGSPTIKVTLPQLFNIKPKQGEKMVTSKLPLVTFICSKSPLQKPYVQNKPWHSKNDSKLFEINN